MRHQLFYYKMRQLLQNVMALLQNALLQGQKSCLHNKKIDIMQLTKQNIMPFVSDVIGFRV